MSLRKFILCFVVCCVCGMNGFAQPSSLDDYDFSTGVDATRWIALQSPTTIVNLYTDDASYGPFPIGFTFNLCGTDYSQFKVNTNGTFSLGDNCSYSYYVSPFGSSNAGYNIPKIVGVGRDLSTGNGGYIRYQLTGSAPNRILVCEFFEAVMYGSSYAASIKWQVQLHEHNNDIYIVYGTNNATPANFQIGIGTGSLNTITINPNNHTKHFGTSSETFNTWPGNNRYYRLSPTEPCGEVSNLNVESLSACAVLLTWDTTSSPSPLPIFLEYSTDANFTSATRLEPSECRQLLSNLSPNTTYYVRVAISCDGITASRWSTTSFTTAQIPCISTGNVTHSIGSSTITNQNLMGNSLYNYSTSQQIYRAEELGGSQDISKIAFHVYQAFHPRNIKIYLGHTTQSSTSTWIAASDLTLVYNGQIPTVASSSNGTFVEFSLSTPFHYNGTDNLLLVIDDNTGNWSGSPYNQSYTHNNGSNHSIYYYSDGSNFDPEHPSSQYFSTTNQRMNFRWVSTSCILADSCMAPLVYVAENTLEGTHVVWGGRQDTPSWNIYLEESGNRQFITNTSSTEYTFHNLSSDTYFSVFVVPACADGDMEHAGSCSFSTPCQPNPGECIAYDNLYSCNTVCRHGTSTAPNTVTGVVDFGFSDNRSQHTVITDTSYYDPRTNNQLRAIYPGTTASVRLGSWKTGDLGQSISYQTTIDTNSFDLLLIHYAAVAKNVASHNTNTLPRFYFAITSIDGNPNANTCSHTNISYNASTWNTFSQQQTYWIDWTTTGIDLRTYHGHTIEFTITTSNCTATNEHNHYCYAYFSLECNKMSILCDTSGCDSYTLEAPLGFSYSWHKSDNPEVSISTSQHLSVSESGEYHCSLSPLNGGASACSVELSTIVNYHPYIPTTVTIKTACDSFVWHDSTYTQSGTYSLTYLNEHGCPSTDTLHLTVNYGTHDTASVTACDSYSWHNSSYTQSSTYTHSYTNEAGCPSTDTLHLTVNYGTHDTASVTACDSYSWHNSSYTQSGTYTHSYTNEADCPSTDTLHLTVNYGSHDTTSVSACDSFSWHESTYTQSGTYTHSYTNEAGCPSTDTLHLTVNYGTHDTASVTACDSYSWHDSPYTQSGTYTHSYTNEAGCPSTDTLHLTVNYSSHNATSVTACDSYSWHGSSYTQSGTYTHSYTNGIGCPSTDTLHLTINYGTHDTASVSACDSYSWHESSYTQSGTYTYDYTNADGCPSTETLHLTINYGSHDTASVTACDSYAWHNSSYTQSVTYTHSYTNEAGCPSTDTLHLTVNYGSHDTASVTACDSYSWYNSPYTQSGTYTHSYTNEAGCPSTDTLHLTINYGSHDTASVTACDSYYWHNSPYTQSGTYTYDYTNVVGCPSTDTLHLIVNYSSHNAIFDSACESYSWHESSYTQSGTYLFDYSNEHGCPSTDTLHLTVNHGTHNAIIDSACESYSWHESSYTQSGTYLFDYSNEHGCSSTDTLHLTVNYSTHDTASVTTCDSYSWHNSSYTQSGTFLFDYSNEHGCFSTDTLHLTVNYSSHNAIFDSACESYSWHDSTYTHSGTYTHSYTNEAGCPSTDTLHLTANYGTHDTTSVTACDSYSWHNSSYTQSGTYTHSYTNEAGCPSTDTLHLTINYGTHDTASVTACDSYSWHNSSYTQSGTYTHSYTNGIGCPSTDTLHLTVNYSSHNAIFDSACESYSWNDSSYTQSGTYTHSYTNGVGCPSTDTLHLTVNYGSHDTDSVSACDSYSWHESPYTQSGTYTHSYTNVDGCPSTDTLHLTVNYGSHDTASVTACDSYSWHGSSYTQSGSYTHSYTNEIGCPSTDTLHLTVNYGSHNTASVTACDSYAWHNSSYTQSGTYTHSYTNEAGCPSTDTLHLTVNYGSHDIASVTACDSFSWHNSPYTQSGTYTHSYTTEAGCPSTDTLHLTINYGTHDTASVTACDSYFWHNSSYTQSGTYTHSYTNGIGCPSTDTLHLTVNYSSLNTISDSACESYSWHDSSYTQSGTYTYDYSNEHGCPSTDTLHLTVNYGTHDTASVTACDSYSWHDSSYTQSGTFLFDYSNEHGCSSTDMLHLTVNYGTHDTTSDTACDSYSWHESSYTQSGAFLFNYINELDCPSTDTLHLTVNYSFHNAIFDSACESYSWHDSSYSQSGTYTYDYSNEHGCSSTDTLHLTIHHGSYGTDTITACDVFEWHGSNYIQNGTYHFNYTNEYGCQSSDTLRLTVHHHSSSNLHQTIVENELPYSWNGVVFNRAGTQQTVIANHFGCDSTITMTLEVLSNTTTRLDSTVCDNVLPILWNGLLFEAAGVQTLILTAASGADSIVSMNLIVNPTFETNIEATACDNALPYTWNGFELFEETTQSIRTTSTKGCDSVAILHLSIGRTYELITYDTVCQGTPFFYNGIAIYETGVYRTMFHTSVGCDSLTELNLWALPHPAVNIHDDYSCLTAWHSIVAETDAPFHKWTAYPETAALEGHEDDLSFPIKPNDSIVFSFFADYSETPICPTTQSITIHPITNVSAEIGITTTTLTPEHHNIQAWDNSVGNSNRSWYINNTYIHDSASFSYSASLDEDSILLQLIAFNDYCSDTAQKTSKSTPKHSLHQTFSHLI